MSDTIVSLSINRTIEGIKVTVNSPELEEVFVSLSGGSTETIDCYNYNQTLSVYDITGTANARDLGLVCPPDRPLYTPRDGANLTILRAAGVGDELTIELPELHSREALKQFCRKTRNSVGEIYREFVEELNFDLDIQKNDN
jgi:hypothetical protein